jgi:hypothetical protein
MERRRRLKWLVVALLLTQLAVLLVSMGAVLPISPFCAVVIARSWGWILWVHYFFGLCLLLGLASLQWPKLRPFYVAALLVAFPVLPLQAHLVAKGELGCDGP